MLRLLAALAASVALASPGTSAPPRGAPEPAAAPGGRVTVQVIPPTSGPLGPARAELAAALLAAALESGGRYLVVGGKRPASWRIDLSASGKGPWRLQARAEEAAAQGRPRRATARASVSAEDDLPRAAEELALRLHEQWSAGASEDGRPQPLARALSPSSSAVAAYASALAELREGDAAAAGALLDAALAADHSFALAAAEKVYTDLTAAGPFAGGGAVAEAAQAALRTGASQERGPAARVARPLSALIEGRHEEALRHAEALRGGHGELPWGRILHGLALARAGRQADALEDWGRLAAVLPGDPRAQAWLGRSRMAAGDFRGAAAAFRAARTGWPGLLWAYTLEAECHARLRDTAAARAVVVEMKAQAERLGIRTESDATTPDLLLGSVDLLEGRFAAALKGFEEHAGRLAEAGVTGPPVYTLLTTILEMRRDLVASPDPLARQRQLDDAAQALDRLEAAMTSEDRELRPWVLLRLRGLLTLKEGRTIEAWRIIDDIKSFAGRPDYTDFEEAFLTAATLLKEGDVEGCAAHFARAASVRGRIVDQMNVAQTHHSLRRFEEARRALLAIEEELQRYDPGGVTGADELVLADPQAAALLPLYHYARAQLAFDTGDPAESRRHFNYMLKYLHEPDENLMPIVKEAYLRGATPQ